MRCFLSIGASIYACRATGRHIVALEEDKSIFDALLAPLIHPIPIPQPTPQSSIAIQIDDDEEVVPIRRLKKTLRFSK